MTTQTAIDDDIFARPPRALARQQTQTVRRQCRACDLTYVVALDYDGPPLCEGCRADVEATRGRIQARLDKVLAQGDVATDTWLAFASAHVDDWDRVQAARKLPDFDERAKAHRAKGNIYGRLLDAHAAYETALAALGDERARLGRALEACDGR